MENTPEIDDRKPDASQEVSDGELTQAPPKEFPKNFDPSEFKEEFQKLVEQKFGGKVQVLAMDSPLFDDGETESTAGKSESSEIESSIEQFQYKPKDIKDYLDRFVVGQDEAKVALAVAICDHYNHLKATSDLESAKESIPYQKQNMMIMGPTGVGKTYMVRLIADLIGIPFIKVDATRFSEVGYMGANVDDIIRDLVQLAKGDKDLAAKGIVYVDEVDKLASRRDHTGRDVGFSLAF